MFLEIISVELNLFVYKELSSYFKKILSKMGFCCVER